MVIPTRDMEKEDKIFMWDSVCVCVSACLGVYYVLCNSQRSHLLLPHQCWDYSYILPHPGLMWHLFILSPKLLMVNACQQIHRAMMKHAQETSTFVLKVWGEFPDKQALPERDQPKWNHDYQILSCSVLPEPWAFRGVAVVDRDRAKLWGFLRLLMCCDFFFKMALLASVGMKIQLKTELDWNLWSPTYRPECGNYWWGFFSLFFLSIYLCVPGCTCGEQGHLAAVGCLTLLVGSRDEILQVWYQVPLPSEPSY